MNKIILLLLSVALFLPQSGYPNTHEMVADLIARKDYENALIEVNTGLKADPENARLQLQKGFILIQTRRLDEAVPHYINLVVLLPENPEPMNNLGVVFMLKQDFTRAVRQLNATVKRFPDFNRAYENLGDLIGNARYINIQIQDIKVISQAEDLITLEFSQHYESNTYQNLSKKRLSLKRYETSWLITSEAWYFVTTKPKI